jgi:hypothetical protein
MANSNNLLNNLLSAFPQLGANQPVNNTVPAANGSPVINNNNVVATYKDFFTSTSSASMWGIDRGTNLELLGTEAMEKIYYNALQNGGELTPQNYFDLAKHQKLMAWATQLKNTDAANREWVISGLGNDGMASGPSA